MSKLDWQSDLLYKLILQKAEEEWEFCQLVKDHSRYILISEHSSQTYGFPTGEILQTWIRDKDGLRSISPSEHAKYWKMTLDDKGQLISSYPFIIVQFYILPDRQHVIIGHQYGSLSGGGGQFVVQSDGESIRLEWDKDGGKWIS